MSRFHADVLVLGGGLTGLATAYFLRGRRECVVCERESAPGGLARSVRCGKFTFDLTGHLLHMRRPENRALVKRLLRGNWVHVERRSSVFSHGALTPYPFQANLHGLPPEVVRECLLSFVGARQAKRSPEAPKKKSFKAWARETFGDGIARHFMIPYNEKLWRTDLDALTADWVSWSVPRPSLEDVVRGALGIGKKQFGYNPTFLYPREGGVGAFSTALARRVDGLRLGACVRAIDLRRRKVRFANGDTATYNCLVSTMPLPRLVGRACGVPQALQRLGGKLRFVNVLNFNLGLRGKKRCESHWVYFPEKEFVFYRVGFPSNFAPALAPRGHSTAYVEVSYRSGERPRVRDLYRRVVEGLKRWGAVKREGDIAMVDARRIEPAYVLFDGARREAVERLRAFFDKHGVASLGRYGQWDYLSMEDSLNAGRAAAERLAK
ncbi:MAG: FAD-dependent oxidoreductase [Acidobacteriota bacterium]|nr:MAG: FAD-dependent oxidoreductase [Acidobacteriota bacterium]